MPSSSARSLAAQLLEGTLPQRWSHVVGVAQTALEVTQALGVDDENVLAAAWLHDIGYAPSVKQTGFHSLDGARYLRRDGWANEVVNLVAHHSAATIEAEERQLDVEMADFPEPENRDALELLWYCDMTTGPSGDRVSVDQRLAEIRERYGPEALVTRFLDRAEEQLLAVVRRVEERLRLADD